MMFKCHRKLAIVTAILLITSISNPQGFLNNSYATPLFVGTTTLDSNDPIGGSKVAVSADKVFSIWLDTCGDIQYARSIDDGANFTPSFPISGDTGCSGLAGSGRVAAADSNVYVVWNDGLSGTFLQSSTNDGLTFNGIDNCPLVANPGQEDSDGNGIGDACDVVDTDIDGFTDNVDNCPLVPNADQADLDGDGIGDACALDTDSDGVDDAFPDNCPLISNFDQADLDGDGIGDACALDTDSDGVDAAFDNCLLDVNPGQENSDGDGIGDACDVLPNDTDNDGIDDAFPDNCPLISNFDQADLDGDGIGDACAVDTDSDGVDDAFPDNCPLISNFDQADLDGDGIGDACDVLPNNPADTDNDGVGVVTFVTSDLPSFIEISATGNYLYIVWRDGSSNVQMAASADNGATFSYGTLDSSGTSFTPVVSSSGDNAYVAWQNPSGDVVVKKITFNGFVFDFSILEQNLSGTSTATNPKIASTDSNVYVTWIDTEIAAANGEIYFSQSINDGDSFNGVIAGTPGAPVNLSGNTGTSQEPDIAAADNNVYVVWRDTQVSSSTNFEILLQSSSNNGVTFNGGNLGAPVNLSDNPGKSTSPKVSAFGTEAYVVWKDDTLEQPSGGDILFRTIINNGNTIGGIKNISQSSATSSNPKVASSATNVSVVWDDNTPKAITFNHATPSTVDVSLDRTQYGLGDTATVTVIAGTGLPILVDIYKNGAPLPEFSSSLSEIDSTGVYTGTILFSTDPTDGPSGILNTASGDLIEVTEQVSGQKTFASIVIPGTVRFTPFTEAYDRGNIAHVTVADPSANTNPLAPDSVFVEVTSLTDTSVILLTLPETGDNTGVFGNTINNKLIFMDSENLWPPNSQITITQKHTDADTTPGIDTISETITSTSAPGGISLDLTETGINTGIFSGVLTLSDVGSVDGSTIKAVPGDIVSVIRGAAISNALVTTGPSNIRGILVNSDPLTDKVTVTYGASTAVAKVEKQFSSGGGGGGLARAGFVVNVVAGISLFGTGGSGGNSPPSFGQSSFAIIEGGQEGFGGILNDNDATTLDQTKTFKVGEKAVLRFDYTEGGGIGKIEHIGLYANVRDGQKRQDSDAYIYFDPLKSPQVTVHDPNGLFSQANFELLQEDVTKFVLKFDLTFAKPMAKSDLILESWNIKKWSSITKISNAIEVTSSGILSETESVPVKTFLEDVTDDQVIPVWVKSNAKWWSDGTIDNDNFISGLEYLVNEGIITVSLPEGTDNSISEMPSWIKSTAGWWADDMISEDEFVTAIEWLISNNIIQVAA